MNTKLPDTKSKQCQTSKDYTAKFHGGNVEKLICNSHCSWLQRQQQ